MMAAMKYSVVLVVLYSIPATATTAVFHTNCTRPASDSHFNFVTAPNTRGTFEILWSCLFTLFICTWQVQHLNVLPQNSSSRELFWKKPWWMVVTLLAPEILVGTALEDFVLAKRSVRYMQHELPKLVEEGGWTMTHAFYANMYGFMVRRRVRTEGVSAISPISTDLLVLNVERMVIYLKSLPSSRIFITEADIQRRAKGDIFVKCIAGFQVFWFIVQVCARKAQNLQISQLEIAVLAFAICTLPSYLLWIKKPQDVSVPTILDEGPEPLPISDDWFDNRDASSEASVNLAAATTLAVFDLPLGIWLGINLVGFSVGGTIFGAAHLLAWNLHFPTHTEKILWRTFSIITTAIPPLFLLFFVLVYTYEIKKGVSTHEMKKTRGIYLIFFGLYAIFRLYLVVESFRSLGFLPAGAFVTTWSTYMPHVM